MLYHNLLKYDYQVENIIQAKETVEDILYTKYIKHVIYDKNLLLLSFL